MRALFLAAVTAALLSSASLAWAQQKPPAPPKDDSTTVSGVTVTARNSVVITKKTFPSVVDKFVQSHVTDGPHGKLTRWLHPLCPAVVGLTPAMNAFVYHRLLAVADEVGAPKPQPGGCRNTNVLVLFTTEPQKVMDDVRDHEPALLGPYLDTERAGAAIFKPPIKAWYATGSRDVGIDPRLDMATPQCPYRRCLPFGSGTGRLRNDLLSEFFHVLVVVDSSAIDGQPIGKIADNVAERVLTNPGAGRGCSSLPSVLDALDQACSSSDSVEALTDYDLAFLKGLYQTETDARIEVQRADIFRQIMRQTRPPALAGN